MSRNRNNLLLSIARTDSTFERVQWQGQEVWRGKCIHCNTPLWLRLDGAPISPVTVEHLLSRNHGGDNDLRNLALACSSCNNEKGRRVDNQWRGDPRVVAVVSAAQERRQKRWRDDNE